MITKKGFTLMTKGPSVKHGFTLIELLVSITLVGILTGVGTVGYNQYNRRSSVTAAQQQVVSLLRQGLVNAQSGKKVNCLTALDGWRVTFTAVSAVLEEKCGTNVYPITTFALPPSVTVTTLPNPNPILFKVLNRGTDVVGVTGIGITGFGIQKGILVKSSGEISMSDTLQ